MSSAPFCIEAKIAHEKKQIWFDSEQNAHLIWEGEEKVISKAHQYNLIECTLFGLNERLTLSSTSPVMDDQGTTLRDLFNEEWEKYNDAITNALGSQVDYGYYAYYPEKCDLVWYAPPFWHKVVSVASSSKLLADKEKKLSWKQIRKILEETTIAVAGCSVGSNVAHMVVMDMRPNHIKLADKSLYKMENINRVRLQYNEIVKSNAQRGDSLSLPFQNKAETVARQLWAIDPYIFIDVFAQGVHEGNINEFLTKNDGVSPIDFLVEEVDDPKVKIFLRQEARKRKIPLLMVTDIGSCVQMDILRFDLDENTSYTYAASDEALLLANDAVTRESGNKKVFFEFVDTLIGKDYDCDELSDILHGRSEVPTSTIIPQLGSTAAMAGAIAAEAIARIRLGEVYPPRMIINKKTFEVKIYH